MKHLSHLAAAAVLAGVVTTGAAVAPAQASHGGDSTRVSNSGTCDGARWKIKAKEDDGRIEVEAEIDSNRAGQRWTWSLQHNGSVSARGASRTAGRSGSFSVERKVVDVAGTDTFSFRAKYGDRECLATLRYPA